MQAQLRPYQAVGVNWLWFLARLGLGGCLADDMGLGKTLQVLALLLKRKTEAATPGRVAPARGRLKRLPNLLVVPASLLANWRAEIERFTPALSFRDRPSLRGGGAAGVAGVAGGTAARTWSSRPTGCWRGWRAAAAGVEPGHSG